jgi:uncharacterized protein (TIGR02145 family)
MKSIFRIQGVILLLLLLLTMHSCKKDKATPPVLTTTTVTGITQTTAISGGNITSEGGASVVSRGICWNTSINPTISDSKTVETGSSGSFVSNLTLLAPNTIYHVRAYATNSAGTGYGNDLSFTTLVAENINDTDGNVYHPITIGTQTWMVENLKTTKYNDNTYIPRITVDTLWGKLSTPAYCWYNNDSTGNKSTYGALYNWFAVNTGKLCPTGWHVATYDEWQVLFNYLGGDNIPGKLKEAGTAHWASPNTGATNSSGFTALPGGQRSEDGVFDFALWNGLWWTSTEVTAPDAFGIWIATDLTDVYSSMEDERQGYSVRCLKDN